MLLNDQERHQQTRKVEQFLPINARACITQYINWLKHSPVVILRPKGRRKMTTMIYDKFINVALFFSSVDFYMYLGSKVFFSAVCGSAINPSKLDLISKGLSLTVVITPTCGQRSRTQVLEPRSRLES